MAYKLKTRTQFPASVSVGSPLTLVKNGVSYVFGVDVADLTDQIEAGLSDVYEPKREAVFYLEDYLSETDPLAAAVADAVAASGGTIVFSASYSLGSGVVGIDLDSIFVPIRLTGPDGMNGGTGQSVMITYSGTGVMLSGVGKYGLEVDHLYFRVSGAGATHFDLDDAAYVNIHDNVIVNDVSSASSIGFTLDNTQHVKIADNTIAIVGGTAIRGIAPAGSWSIKALVDNNVFLASNNICIDAPGQDWTISNNIAQNPVTHFIKAGPAGRADVLNVFGNDIDDITGVKTIITSNAYVLNSGGNRFAYSGGTITCISQTNSTGTVNSSGDRLSGTVGIAIGTGNYLNITAPVGGVYAPTTLYTGTPANTDIIHTVGGAADITGRLSLGKTGATASALRFYNATSGHVEVTTDAGALGSNTIVVPGFNDTLVVRSGAQTLQNKTINNTNIVTFRDDRFTLQDNADTTKQAVFELSGIATATTRTYTAPNASGTLALTATTAATVKKQIFTASGTYTPSTGMLYCIVEAVGGGGGGGAVNSTGTTQVLMGGGGGAGGYSRSIITAATIGASQVVTIGAAGAGGAAGSNDGVAGGDTSLGALVIGKGGAGGTFALTAVIGGLGGAGGVAGTGDFAPGGTPGMSGCYAAASNYFSTPMGGASVFGGPGTCSMSAAGGGVAGTNATGHGSGGGGAGVGQVTTTRAGGNGKAGVIIITEFCNQ